ncbi:MAG: hypothetical protein COV70_03795 [Parcubacteria group bacterium CG11_big_fil_rev_8_21_14_0_20_39_22]|nr:MAG: hypothetical protein COV70_03795 [Parcubacteria group bacterium CG11_big_fil_rev_8_21_14_0_20_39_22]
MHYLIIILITAISFFLVPIAGREMGLYEEYLNLLDITIWPAVVIIVALSFRKILAYLFFSVEEFSFFGAKGRLKDVRELIEEKAENLKAKQEINEQSKEMLKEFDESIKKIKERTKNKDRVSELGSEIIKENETFRSKLSEKDQEIIILKNEIEVGRNIDSIALVDKKQL